MMQQKGDEAVTRAAAERGSNAPPPTIEQPRIYGLKPKLAGPVTGWPVIFKHAAELGFNLVHVDGQSSGSQGGAFAIRPGARELPQAIRGADARPLEEALTEATTAARELKLGVVIDMAFGPEEPAPLQLFDQADGLLEEVRGQIDLALKAGVAGFLCRRAHAVPLAIWRQINAFIRERAPRVVMIADTLGAAPDLTIQTAEAGFDFIFNSGAWWDFRQDWLLEQYGLFRHRVATIAFPEDDRTGRILERFGGLSPAQQKTIQIQRYLFSVGFSSGVWMPMGYEYGVRGTSEEAGAWARCIADRDFDLTGLIAQANMLKAEWPALQAERLLRPVSVPDSGVCAFMRFDAELETRATAAGVILVNPTNEARPAPPLARLLAAGGGCFGLFEDVTPQLSDTEARTRADPLRTLSPQEIRILRARPVAMKGDRLEGTIPLDDLAAQRIAIEAVSPEIDGGRFPVKRLVGDILEVSADIFSDGHDKIDASLFYRSPGTDDWVEVPLVEEGNDRWAASIPLDRVGRYDYRISGWKDRFGYWQYEVQKKRGAGLDISVELVEGHALIAEAAGHATAPEDKATFDALLLLEDEEAQYEAFTSAEAAVLMRRCAVRAHLTTYDRTLSVIAERRAAAVAAWYEMFPRSQSGSVDRHGTFDDVIARLPYVRDMGFDVLYFPPIHPIGRKNRKGRNNTLTPGPDDPGSPYAIGSDEGGHDALHPELGTFEDFERLVAAAAEHGLEIALDFAIQCSPDHPWVRNHPEWFDWRPDGSIKYAENPPKKYEDIVNVHFYRAAFPSIWYALRDVVLFWAGKGVKIFRVDNPHTKPFPFWEWMIREVQDQYPDTIFLAEAFTRPKVMKRLAKLGFTQSYSYFTWRDLKDELIEYMTELTTEGPQEYMRPNFFANTPDINPLFLQTSGRAGFRARLVLAATLSTVYGIYSGFELCEAEALPGREEYLDSEKYEIRAWDWDRPGHIRDDVTLINRIRKMNPALWSFSNLVFLNCWNDQIIAYYKATEELDNCVMVAVNLDPHNAQTAAVEVPLWAFGLPDDASIEVVDLVHGNRFTWTGKLQTITLDPADRPYRIWRLVPPLS